MRCGIWQVGYLFKEDNLPTNGQMPGLTINKLQQDSFETLMHKRPNDMRSTDFKQSLFNKPQYL